MTTSEQMVVSTAEFAKATHLTQRYIQRLCRAGKLSAQKTPCGSHWRIHGNELVRWILGFDKAGGARRSSKGKEEAH